MQITELNGVGPKTAALLKKLKIETVEDLFLHYPRRYETHPAPIPISQIVENQKCAVQCVVKKEAVKGNNGLMTLYISDRSGRTSCKWFQNPWINKIIKVGREYVFFGKVTEYQGRRYFMQPTFMEADEYRRMIGSLTPVYPLTAGISNDTLFKCVLQAIQFLDEKETLPYDVIKENHLISHADAIRCIHYPGNAMAYKLARERIVFEEFYDLIYSIRKNSLNRGFNYYRIHSSPTADRVIASLPYDLTGSQKQVMQDIRNDFNQELVSNRLVQGDVGSGKTMIALLSMIIMADNQFQSALMAPTEVLATQHYKELCEILENTGKVEEFKPVLLVGSMKEKEKAQVRENIRTGESRIVIGTHAIIQEKVEYKDLALAVIDEQHRFGVEQRKHLAEKGMRPVHTIVMTATPIPQTTGQILFGGMNLSIMSDKPAGRKPIINYAVTEDYRTNIYKFLGRELYKGHQVYVICPMVIGDDDGRKSVEESYKKYTEAFPGIAIGKLHGKMNPKEKNDVMGKFSEGEIKILISTTVVEVGVNVPNASVIVIEGANNFGMLQLHQLRGRVGRGDAQSYCIFINSSTKPSEKLQILATTNDGFKIAEADYQLRKAGDLLGTKQSGDMGFRLADTIKDEAIAKRAEYAVEAQMNKETGSCA